ncbi:acetate kinase [Desulfofarcimen acetoxidans DSM 771]|uniref:Acetate kinase n=1 Tax=Desulfofarcimen acetoxidans (strain ATCC 49208 / DSM 771 / KCTC 5769 / VKM B-1644 / 5575) TaxID=485916 RepID=C8W573_DESAS|nr:acetate kinase [Desulfofarcimen acetoxidans]ACV62055.1 acetate kinase [Desulfofarcimen acetoxidans DSM 771]
MKVLVMNCGSSSLKYQLLDMTTENLLAKGLVERIGIAGSFLTHEPTGKDKVRIETEMPTHTVAIKLVLDALINAEHGVIGDMKEIDAVGHRVVHGGETFTDSAIVTEEIMKAIVDCKELAPLHNPANIMGIEACQELMPDTPQVAVFDTAFHQTMPEASYIYGIPYEYYEKYKIRRYGFHGTSHKYVAQRAAVMLGKDPSEVKVITCHLGNGASIAAVKNGKVVDTSMGFTPLEGLVMGTRCGSIDSAILPFLMEKEGLSGKEIDNILNKKSGMLGISGISSDMRDIGQAMSDGNHKAQIALEVYAHYVRKYIGSYAAVMNGVDAIVFTAGIGENAIDLRAMICEGLQFLGTELDPVKNDVRGKEVNMAKDGSKVAILLIPTNEELVIARDTKVLCG